MLASGLVENLSITHLNLSHNKVRPAVCGGHISRNNSCGVAGGTYECMSLLPQLLVRALDRGQCTADKCGMGHSVHSHSTCLWFG